jgi:hypothetical protein
MIYIYRPKDILYLKHEAEWIYVSRKWGMAPGIERAWAMYLDKEYRLLEFVMSNRSDNRSSVMVDVEGIVTRGYSIGAKFIIFFHCHPNSPHPSQQDYLLLQTLNLKAREFEMKVLESIIEGNTYAPFCMIQNQYADMLESHKKLYNVTLQEKFSLYRNSVHDKQIIAGLDYCSNAECKKITDKIASYINENIKYNLYKNYSSIRKYQQKQWKRREQETAKPYNFGDNAKTIPSIVDIKFNTPNNKQYDLDDDYFKIKF